jgi:hypothetical protein
MVWTMIQSALVPELGRLGQLPELRLRVYPIDYETGAQLNKHHDDSRSPAYEAVQGNALIDGMHSELPQIFDN